MLLCMVGMTSLEWKKKSAKRLFLSPIILSFDLSLFVDCYEYLQSMDSWERQQTYSMLCTFVIFHFIMFYSKLKVEWWDLVALNFVLMFINFFFIGWNCIVIRCVDAVKQFHSVCPCSCYWRHQQRKHQSQHCHSNRCFHTRKERQGNGTRYFVL